MSSHERIEVFTGTAEPVNKEDSLDVVLSEEEVILVELNEGPPGDPGPQGPEGPPGEAGPQGPAGVVQGLSYVHKQDYPAIVWTVQHNLGYEPAVSVFDFNDNLLLGWKVYWQDSDVLLLTFNKVQSGKAIVS